MPWAGDHGAFSRCADDVGRASLSMLAFKAASVTLYRLSKQSAFPLSALEAAESILAFEAAIPLFSTLEAVGSLPTFEAVAAVTFKAVAYRLSKQLVCLRWAPSPPLVSTFEAVAPCPTFKEVGSHLRRSGNPPPRGFSSLTGTDPIACSYALYCHGHRDVADRLRCRQGIDDDSWGNSLGGGGHA